MLINVVEPEEARVAVIEDGSLEELYIERTSATSLLGNIYKGRVVSIEPSIQAAFVDFGIDKNGFLHVSDVMPAYGKLHSADAKLPEKRDIQVLLRRGQEVLVQVSKEEIGTKVPTLTTYLSLPGRFMVLMPSISKRGISKKIVDDEERRKLRDLLDDLSPPKGMGYIIRTAGADRSKSELVRDLNYLLNLWKAISKRVRQVTSPAPIYQESDLVVRTIRDTFAADIEEIVVDENGACERARQFFADVMPRYADRVRLYEEREPLFHRFGVEEQIERLYDRRVPLPSGGSIVIDPTEALVAIDVNSGKYKENDNLEETAYKTNLEAAKEACRQLKLRDLGGVICVDFIDMRSEKHRNAIERLVRELLKKDRARTRAARMSRFCILEITRQRVRQSIGKTHYEVCPLCHGTGSVKTVESMGLSLVRQLRARVARRPGERIEVHVHPDVATYIHTKKKDALRSLEEQSGKPVLVKPEKGLSVEQYKFSA